MPSSTELTELPETPAGPAPIEPSDVQASLAEDSAKLCIICNDKPRSVRLMPCGHCSTCADCTTQLIRSRRESGMAILPCPVCRVRFTRLARIPAPDNMAEPQIARIKTYEPANDSTTSMSVGEYMGDPQSTWATSAAARVIPIHRTPSAARMATLARQTSGNLAPARITRQMSNRVDEDCGWQCFAVYVIVICGLGFGLPHIVPATSSNLWHAFVWPTFVLGICVGGLGRNCYSGHAIGCFWMIFFVFAPIYVWQGRVMAGRHVTSGVGVGDWAAAHAANASEIFLFTDGYVATDMQVSDTVFDWNGDSSSYTTYSIAPVFADASCTTAPRDDFPARCEVAFMLLFDVGSAWWSPGIPQTLAWPLDSYRAWGF